ncbi:MAG: hypothetical protein RI911_9 [Candidatus Parcubacteria bacterium]|jgi:uncharacterized membrane protein YraQ (UPF0718 family)
MLHYRFEVPTFNVTREQIMSLKQIAIALCIGLAIAAVIRSFAKHGVAPKSPQVIQQR